MTSTTSWTPVATTIAPIRKASDPEGQAFSTRVQGMPDETQGARHRVATHTLLAPEGAPLGRHDGGVDGRWVEALVHVDHGGVEGARGHLLVALFEEFAELDQPGADDGHPVPTHEW